MDGTSTHVLIDEACNCQYSRESLTEGSETPPYNAVAKSSQDVACRHSAMNYMNKSDRITIQFQNCIRPELEPAVGWSRYGGGLSQGDPWIKSLCAPARLRRRIRHSSLPDWEEEDAAGRGLAMEGEPPGSSCPPPDLSLPRPHRIVWLC